jgi:hypothetical protein
MDDRTGAQTPFSLLVDLDLARHAWLFANSELRRHEKRGIQ